MSKRLRRENEYLTEEVKAGRNQRLLVGASPSFGKVVELVKAVTLTDTTVILLGETGTGKEVLAQALHDLDTRRQQPFIRVNCAALPPPGYVPLDLPHQPPCPHRTCRGSAKARLPANGH